MSKRKKRAWLVLWCDDPGWVFRTKKEAEEKADELAYKDGLIATRVVPCEYDHRGLSK